MTVMIKRNHRTYVYFVVSNDNELVDQIWAYQTTSKYTDSS